jgi:hypothetical protein
MRAFRYSLPNQKLCCRAGARKNGTAIVLAEGLELGIAVWIEPVGVQCGAFDVALGSCGHAAELGKGFFQTA